MRSGKSGRPPVPKPYQRLYRLRLGLTQQEWRLLSARAKAVGLPPVDFARLMVLHLGIALPRPRLNFQVLGALSNIGNNLNQALRAINSGRLSPELRPSLDELFSLLREIRTALVS